MSSRERQEACAGSEAERGASAGRENNKVGQRNE